MPEKRLHSRKSVTPEDRALLADLGVDTSAPEKAEFTAREQRIMAGFEELERFFEENGRRPEHGAERDIFERIHAVRLESMRQSEECCDLLKNHDPHDLLSTPAAEKKATEGLSDEDILAELGVEAAPEDDITALKHVKSSRDKQAAVEIAQREPCADFSRYKPLFLRTQQELDESSRQTRIYQGYKEIKQGDFFILDGQKLYVTEMSEPFEGVESRTERRLRVIFDNGTESDPLLRSLQRALNKNEANRLISDPSIGPLFGETSDADDIPSGAIYILRSNSSDTYIQENKAVIHKIGGTSGDLKKRLANAKKDPTFLMAEVEIVGSYQLANINRTRLESLLHQFFSEARLHMKFKDRFGYEVTPREWFLVPFDVIEKAVGKLKEGHLDKHRYDPKSAQIVKND